MEKERSRAAAVSSAPANLLVVAVDGLRKARMEHGPHVGLIDPKAEGRRADDDIYFADLGADVGSQGVASPAADDLKAFGGGG
jgi:hypothetical protein